MSQAHLIDGLPARFVERLQQQFPEQFEELLSTFGQRPPVVRVNTLFLSPSDLQQQFQDQGIETEEIEVLPNAFVVTNADRKTLTALKSYEEGAFYIQSIASQLAVKALDPQPGEKILDLCSAPGSKTTQIAILMQKQGELLANDNSRQRMFRLMSNLKHQQVDDFVEVKNHSGQNYPKFYSEHFDRVLVDAPCSSESRFDPRYPKSINFWSRHKVKASAKIQRRLLSAGIQCCRSGGTIVYSTCTFAPEENEMVVNTILKKHPEVEIEMLDWPVERLPILESWNEKDLSIDLQKALRLQPDAITEGFFVCRFHKR